MKIRDFANEHTVNTLDELERVLSRRFGEGANSFWIYAGDENVPALLILIMDDVASLHFFPSEDHPGFSSVGDVEEWDANATSLFYMDGTDAPQEVNNDTILEFDKALEAAKEFFVNQEPPKCIEWREL